MLATRPSRRPFRQASPALLAGAPLLLLASAAQGQSLTIYSPSTDNITVDGTGTYGTSNGFPLKTNTTSYSSVSVEPASNNSSESIPAFTLGDGGSIDDTATGGGSALTAQLPATITITGGTINADGGGMDAVDVENLATVSISGGTMSADGGTAFFCSAGGTTTVSGGTFIADDNGVALESANATPGEGLNQLTVTGGVFETDGQYGADLYCQDASSVIALYGQFYFINPDNTISALSPGDTEALPQYGGGAPSTFYGTLENESAEQAFTYVNEGNIVLYDVAVPEPSSVAILALGALGLGGLRRRARRRDAVALPCAIQ